MACGSRGKNIMGAPCPKQWHQKTISRCSPLQKSGWSNIFPGKSPLFRSCRWRPSAVLSAKACGAFCGKSPMARCSTYGDIAKKMAAKLGRERMSSQAVGGAVGHNPISIIIPCHRVVGAHGSLTGFAAGIPTKLKLLQAEGVDTSKFFIPPKGTAL